MTTHIQERIQLLNKEIAGTRRSTNWSSNLALLIGLVCIVLLCGYFGYGYKALNDVTQPKMIVEAAKGYMGDYSIEARKVASAEIRKSAPIWAQEASIELVANMPTFRKQAESTVETYFNEQIAMSQGLAGKEFKKIIQDNREDFGEAIKLMVEEGNSDEFVDTILPIIEKSSEIDLKDNAMLVLGGLDEINRRLEKLATGTDLNPLEEQQRHILGLTRVLREE